MLSCDGDESAHFMGPAPDVGAISSDKPGETGFYVAAAFARESSGASSDRFLDFVIIRAAVSSHNTPKKPRLRRPIS